MTQERSAGVGAESVVVGEAVPDILYVGIDKHIIAIDAVTGTELWRRKLDHGGSLVTILVKGPCIFAASDGYVFCLDRYMGQVLWTNELKKLGWSAVMMAVAGATTDQAGAAAAAQAAATAG